MSDMNAGMAMGLASDVMNFIPNMVLSYSDRAYQKQLDEQAQKNWEAQFKFQQEQATQQQANWEANRIGNLTKEYADAGLNPALAAGLGASTSNVVGSGGSANVKGMAGMKTPSMSIEGAQIGFQMEQQKEMNEKQKEVMNAQIRQINADTRLAETQADDIEATRENRIDELIAKTNLSYKEAEKVVIMTNAIVHDIELTDEKIKNTQADTLAKEIANELNSKYGAKMTETEIKKMTEEIKNSKNERANRTATQVRQWIDGLLDKAIKGGYLLINAIK